MKKEQISNLLMAEKLLSQEEARDIVSLFEILIEADKENNNANN